MKILFVGDYSNLHATMAAELRRRGHQADVVSNGGGFLGTHADFKLARQSGFIGSWRYLFDIFNLLPRLKGYDVVQMINPHFFALRPGKLAYFHKILRDNNAHTALTLAGDDHFFVRACLDGHTFRFSEFRNGSNPTPFAEATPSYVEGYMRRDVADYTKRFYDSLDIAFSILPEYDMAARPLLADRLHFINIPIELERLPYADPDLSGPIRLFIGLYGGRERQKGTDIMLDVARRLKAGFPGRCELTEARNMPLQQYLASLAGSHIQFDQLYSYSPATNALQAMAMGCVSASGAQPEYYSYIGRADGPVIKAEPPGDDLYERVARLISDPAPLTGMAREGRAIVERHNDVRVVVDKYLAKLGNLR